jgi:hypothetical protein
MGKVILASLLAGSLGGAALVTVGQTYYSTAFLWSFPINCGGFKTTPDLNNVWHWEGDVPVRRIATDPGVAVIVDFNGDGIMDTECPEVRVCITDIQNTEGAGIEVVDSSGIRWDLAPRGQYFSGETHFATPIVVPFGSSIHIRQEVISSFGSTSRVRLIGRVVNI